MRWEWVSLDKTTLLDLIIYVLATWRLSSLFVNEPGPGRIFQYLREFAGIEHDEEGNKTIIPETFWAELLSCVWCSSIWLGIFWALLDLWLPGLAFRLGLIFALSAGAILLEKFR